MPTIILLDVSFSMCRPVTAETRKEEDEEAPLLRKDLAALACCQLLDHLQHTNRLEFVALIIYSSLYEVVVGFTRDYNSIRKAVMQAGDYDKTCLLEALKGSLLYCKEEWGNSTPCQLVVVTDGSEGVGASGVLRSISGPRAAATFPLPGPAPAPLNIICLASADDPSLLTSLPLYQRFVEFNGQGGVHVPQGKLSRQSTTELMKEVLQRQFSPYRGVLQCGSLSTPITLAPPPQVLQRIVSLIRLQEDQLHEILHALKDSWQCIRESVHALLSSCTLTTSASLLSTVEALLDNIRRYPQDVASIQECMVALGERQAGLVAGLVPQLLLTHPYFDAVQPSLQQPHYICKLLLVLNAAACMPTILPVLEEHTLNHYAYLRDTLPHLVPQLQVCQGVGHNSQVVLSNTEGFLQQSLSKLRHLEWSSTQHSLTLYTSVHSDLLKLAALDPTMSAAAHFAALYTRCTLLLTRLLNCHGWLHLESSGNNVQQLVTLTFRLVHAFTGLSPQDVTCARGIRLRALALQLVYVVNGSTGSALGLCEAFLTHAKSLRDSSDSTQLLTSKKCSQAKWRKSEVAEDEFLNVALNELKDERRPGTVARTLQPLLSAHPPMPLPPIVNPRAIHQASAKITQPTQESEAIHKLTAGLPLSILLDSYLYHIPDPSSVRIRICYPDQSVQHVVPRVNHLQPIEESHCYRLQTTLLLTAAVWSEACQVNLSLVLDLSPAGPKRKHDPHTIDLCDPTTLMLWPKTMKKAL